MPDATPDATPSSQPMPDEATHIPGPYTLEDRDDRWAVLAPDGAEIASLHSNRYGMTFRSPEAEGRLLAAAPAMLEALEFAALSLQAAADLLFRANVSDKEARQDAANVRRAIAKATGQ